MTSKIHVVSTTVARKNISALVHEAQMGKSFVLGRRDIPEAILIPFPFNYNPKVSEMTNLAMYGGAFDFLNDEPDLYSKKDIKRSYE